MRIYKQLFFFFIMLLFIQCGGSGSGGGSTTSSGTTVTGTSGGSSGGGSTVTGGGTTTGGATSVGGTTSGSGQTIGGGGLTTGGTARDLTCSVYGQSHNLLQNDTLVSADYYSWIFKTVMIDLKLDMSGIPFAEQTTVIATVNNSIPVSQNFMINTANSAQAISSTSMSVSTPAVNRIPIITISRVPDTSQVLLKVKLYNKTNPTSLLREIECKNY